MVNLSEELTRLPPSRAQTKITRLSRIGLAVCFFLVVVIGGWMVTAPLSSAVVASGHVVVETSVKLVQHSTGGIVTKIFVQNGDHVDLGEPLVALDDTVSRASRDIYQAQTDEMLARQARFLAEAEGIEAINFGTLDERTGEAHVAELLVREQQVFETRLQTKISQQDQLRERLSQIEQEIEGLQAQKTAVEKSISLLVEELSGVRDLYSKGLVALSRLNDLERQDADLKGRLGQFVAEIARARGRLIETGLQIAQLDTQYRDAALAALSETQARLSETSERLRAAQDQLDRVEIVASQAGIVHELAVNTIGGVVGPGETLMQIIPTADALVVDVKVSPTEIDRVAIGQDVRLQIHAGNQRTQSELLGKITRVSPDLIVDDRTGAGYYLVRAALPDDAAAQLGDISLIPGMAATSFIQTGSRTAMEYLLKPLQEQISRTFQER